MTELNTSTIALADLPGLDCGLCGMRTCAEMATRVASDPSYLKRCLPRSGSQYGVASVATGGGSTSSGIRIQAPASPMASPRAGAAPSMLGGCTGCGPTTAPQTVDITTTALVDDLYTAQQADWSDTLGRPFDFYLEHFPEDPGPREIMIPHNPMLTREMDIQPGDVLIGRPLGMSCGCPITHCGVAREVDQRTGVIVWCVTGPLDPRKSGCKDLGYYIAEGYEGMIRASRVEPRIGMRHYFQPRMCMLQWRHSGLINYLNRTPDGWQVRLEGLWIG